MGDPDGENSGLAARLSRLAALGGVFASRPEFEAPAEATKEPETDAASQAAATIALADQQNKIDLAAQSLAAKRERQKLEEQKELLAKGAVRRALLWEANERKHRAKTPLPRSYRRELPAIEPPAFVAEETDAELPVDFLWARARPLTILLSAILGAALALLIIFISEPN